MNTGNQTSNTAETAQPPSGTTATSTPPAATDPSQDPAPADPEAASQPPQDPPPTDPAATTQPSQDPAPADPASASAPTTQSSDDCAEIPAYPHAVLTGSVKLAVQVPYPTDQATQLPHKLTLSNDDGSYSKTLTLASDSQPGNTDGTSVVTFEDMTENHTYSLKCDNGDTSYTLFEGLTYEQVLKLDTEADGASSGASPDPSTGTAGAPSTTNPTAAS
jgi:hypothetical protein